MMRTTLLLLPTWTMISAARAADEPAGETVKALREAMQDKGKRQVT